ncbi:MAG TPA: hypothetical protein PLV58_02290 [Campylobacterales bacterium]|nr:hypothetical protein [Campylobacterales bacterium]
MRFENGSLPAKDIKLEMLTFTPLCVHENIENCLFIGATKLNGAAKLMGSATFTQNLSVDSNFDGNKFDLIVSFEQTVNLQQIFKLLKEDGIFCKTVNKNIKEELLEAGDYYRIAMPYHNMELLFLSNKYHPTADLILDKSDFLESCEYYNSDTHLASFAIYESAKKELRGVIKN